MTQEVFSKRAAWSLSGCNWGLMLCFHRHQPGVGDFKPGAFENCLDQQAYFVGIAILNCANWQPIGDRFIWMLLIFQNILILVVQVGLYLLYYWLELIQINKASFFRLMQAFVTSMEYEIISCTYKKLIDCTLCKILYCVQFTLSWAPSYLLGWLHLYCVVKGLLPKISC